MRNAEKYERVKLRIETLFTQCGHILQLKIKLAGYLVNRQLYYTKRCINADVIHRPEYISVC